MRKFLNTFLKFNKKKCLLLVLVLALFVVAPNFTQAQSTATKKAAAKSWNAFWTKFSTAVKNKDRKTFTALTRKDYQDAGGGTIEDLFNPEMWREFRKSVNRGTKDYSPGSKNVMRITKGRTLKDTRLIFIYGKQGWKFFGELVA